MEGDNPNSGIVVDDSTQDFLTKFLHSLQLSNQQMMLKLAQDYRDSNEKTMQQFEKLKEESMDAFKQEVATLKSVNDELKAEANKQRELVENLNAKIDTLEKTESELKVELSDAITKLKAAVESLEGETETLKKAPDLMEQKKMLVSKEKELALIQSANKELEYLEPPTATGAGDQNEYFLAGSPEPSKNEIEMFGNVHNLSHLRTLDGHSDSVFDFSSFEKFGMKYLASGSYDTYIQIWDLSEPDDRSLIETLSSSAKIQALTSFVMDGNQFMACSGIGSNNIEIWNLSINEVDFMLTGHSKYIQSLLVFEKNGQYFLLSGSGDASIKLWDVYSMTCVHTFTGHSGSVSCLAMYEEDDVKFLASGSRDGTVKLWNVDSKSMCTTLPGDGNIYAIAVFHKNGKPYLASGGSDKVINIWNLSNYELESSLADHLIGVNTLTTIAMEKNCLASGNQNTIKIWDLENYCLIKTLSVGSPTCSLTTYHDIINDISYLISGHKDGTILFWW